MSEYDVSQINSRIDDIQKQLDSFYERGKFKVSSSKESIDIIKQDKMLSKEEKREKIASFKQEILKAKEAIESDKEEIKKLKIEAKEIVNKDFSAIYASEKEKKGIENKELREQYLEAVKEEKTSFLGEISSLKSNQGEDKKSYESKIQNLKRAHQSKLYELKLNFRKQKQANKSEVHDIYLEKTRKLNNINGNSLTIPETVASKWEKYVYRFNFKDFFLRNGLYIVMILAFVVCCIAGVALGKGNLFETSNLFEILNQSSPKIFLALGVAGLILLAGTDLSVGRMVGMGSVITCMILYPGLNNAPIFGTKLDFTSLPGGFRIILALVVTVIFTTFFSSIAGFFTAKFKMHPFISTMGTQLVIYGLTAVATNSMNTGVIDTTLKRAVTLKLFGVIPMLLIYAIIGILIVSFIWNKTKFGKNMYAVGGNSEAASVSGISVFWVTMGVFIMAGVLYGLGSFFEGVRIGTGKFDTGTGYETDAIAACVIGGISFSGGVGKIKGAVIGTIIFTALSYSLTFLGISPYYQFVIKGIIIIAAVALDCVKYLKKK